MAVKVLEMDISEKAQAIKTSKEYLVYRILIRIDKKPIGWISVSNIKKNDYITYDQLQEAIKNQLFNQLLRQSILVFLNRKSLNLSLEVSISIIICTRNRTKNLINCLKAVFGLKYGAFEVIVVDNAPSDNATLNLVKNMKVRYVREDKIGLDNARNRGITEARNQVVAFTDDDAMPDKYWLQAINKRFQDEEVMAVTGYVAPAELETPAQLFFEDGYGGMGHGFNSRILKRENLTERQLFWSNNFGVGANMAFRKTVFESIGLFDTALDVGTPSCGGGDIEIFHRLLVKNFVLVYEPAMIVWHYHRNTYKDLRKQIYFNGRSFGCYLLTCHQNKSLRKYSIIKYLVVDWIIKWNFKNIIFKSRGIPKLLSFIELAGMFSSPFAFRKSKAYAKKINLEFNSSG